MFRLRRGGNGGGHGHDHDSDAECSSSATTAGGEVASVTASAAALSAPANASTATSSSTSTSAVRRKRVRRSTGSSSSKSYMFQQWMKKLPLRVRSTRPPETSAIFLLGLTGCVIAGCVFMVVLKLFTAAMTTMGSSSGRSNNNNPAHHKKSHGGWGSGAVYNKGPHGGRRVLQHQHAAASSGSARQGDGDDNGSGDGDDGYDVLPWNPIYRIPDAYHTVGDRSDEYARLRMEIDPILPVDAQRSLMRLHELQRRDEITNELLGSQPYPIQVDYNNAKKNADDEQQQRESYDIFNCPDEPPRHYPYEWKLVDEVLHTWPADEIDIPERVHQGLCVFDFVRDYDKALRYRQEELPFIVTGDPDVARTVERWSIPGYMEELMGYSVRHRAEYNTNNHFLYHMPPPRPRRGRRNAVAGAAGRGFGPQRGRRALPPRGGDPSRDEPEGLQDLYGRPAKLQRAGTMPDEIRMTYTEWLSKANVTGPVGPNDEHWYFRLIGCGYMGADGSCDAGSSEYLFDELPFFQPKDNLYLAQGDKQKGIHCRFGMKGVIAENHFDASRNSIVVLRGTRRYILSHPNNCDRLTLLPQGHPSARHSAVDYTNPDLETFPEFAEATANEVVLQAGHVLYLPTNWFHFIVSLDLNMQCNTRSGVTKHYQKPIEHCGF